MELRERIRKTFIDTTDLDLAHQEIGYLKDLCDSKDQVISYQKELLNVQAESIKHFRQIEEAYNQLGKDNIELHKRLEVLENARKTTRGKHNTRNKSRS